MKYTIFYHIVIMIRRTKKLSFPKHPNPVFRFDLIFDLIVIIGALVSEAFGKKD